MKRFFTFLLFVLMIGIVCLFSFYQISDEHSDAILPIVFAMLFIIAVYAAILVHIDLAHEKEITHRGYTIKGRIERIKFYVDQYALSVKHTRRLIVSFTWEASTYKLETLNGVSLNKYKEGDEVDILYLPEYPKKIVLKGELPTSVFGVWFYTVLTVGTSAVILVLTLKDLLI